MGISKTKFHLAINDKKTTRDMPASDKKNIYKKQKGKLKQLLLQMKMIKPSCTLSKRMIVFFPV